MVPGKSTGIRLVPILSDPDPDYPPEPTKKRLYPPGYSLFVYTILFV
jgi:hypothetical protein